MVGGNAVSVRKRPDKCYPNSRRKSHSRGGSAARARPLLVGPCRRFIMERRGKSCIETRQWAHAKPLGRLFLSVASATFACGCGIVLAVDDSQKFVEGPQATYLDTAARALGGHDAQPEPVGGPQASASLSAGAIPDRWGRFGSRSASSRLAADDAQTKLKSFLPANPIMSSRRKPGLGWPTSYGSAPLPLVTG